MLLPLISDRCGNGDHGEKNIGIRAQPDVVTIDVDQNHKPNKMITTSSAAGDVSRLASAGHLGWVDRCTITGASEPRSQCTPLRPVNHASEPSTADHCLACAYAVGAIGKPRRWLTLTTFVG